MLVAMGGVAGVALLAGCGSGPGRDWKSELWQDVEPSYPFLPVRVLVHPLTRAGLDASGGRTLRVHFVFLDAWNDSVKTVGRVQVQLFASGRWQGEAIEPVAWDEINLSDLEANQRHYDPITRTYVLEVGEEAMPPWLPGALADLERVAEQPDEPVRSRAGRLTLRVVFMLETAGGSERITSNDFVLLPG